AEEAIELLAGVVADRLLGIEAGGLEDAGRPAVRGVAGDLDRALRERLRLVVELRQVDVGDAAHALAARAHPARDAEAAGFLDRGAALLERHRALAADRRDVERPRLRQRTLRV